MEYNSDYGSLVSKKSSDSIDGIPLVCGISCLLKQMHVSATYKLMSYLGQYVRSKVHQILSENDSGEGWDDGLQIPELVVNILIFLEQLCRFSSIPRSVVYAYIPPYIFDSYNIPNMKDKQAPVT
jgi:Hereditary spastic paraplegia protein strumpellin